MATTSSPGERIQQKRRTRSALLAAAVTLVSSGSAPSVAEVADAARVSRRTAYRYFPTQEQLLVEASLEGVRGIISEAIEGTGTRRRGTTDVEARLDRVVHAMQQSAAENEQLLRSMIRLTVSAPADPARLKRGYRRIEWIEQALAPIKATLGKRRYDRLVSALSLCMGIEALIVLRDLRGLSDGNAENVSRWAARTLLRESLAELGAKRASK